MRCAELVSTEAGTLVRLSSAQVPDPSACQLVLVEGSDVSALNLFKLPTATEFSAAWVWGFSLVVGSYVIAWGLGAVVNFVTRD